MVNSQRFQAGNKHLVALQLCWLSQAAGLMHNAYNLDPTVLQMKLTPRAQMLSSIQCLPGVLRG